MRGGGDNDGSTACGSESTDPQSTILFTNDSVTMPFQPAAASDTRFSSCEYNDVLMAPESTLGPRYDYTMVPSYDGSPFTLPVPPSTTTN